MESWLELLCCPTDGAPFHWQSHASADLAKNNLNGKLVCINCKLLIPVTNGILRCVTAFDDARKADEMVARDQLAITYEHDEYNREEEAIPLFLHAMQPSAPDTVLDLGCGVGMITRRYASNVRRVIGVDFSLASLEIFRASLPPELQARVLLIHGDICHPPLKAQSFDKIVSSEVFHHLPTADMRQTVLATLAHLLKPQGTYTCSVYNWSVYKQRRSRLGLSDESFKEGKHDSNIYYYNFEAREFSRLAHQAGLQVLRQRGLMVAVPGSGHLGEVGKWLRYAVGQTPLGVKLAHLLLSHGRRA
jgi:ubiquinone/menaquinone biosynthesis C-methylase UbiE/uncharacterized protein YbaR (Trm112 family)